MKEFILLAVIVLTAWSNAYADRCFIMKENNIILTEEGNCITRHSPASTFKIAISLMGFNEKILKDEKNPIFTFEEGYPDYVGTQKQPNTLTMWMKNSCVSYSHKITGELGLKKFTRYLKKLNYGNKDASGDKGKNNGLTNAWISSSLEINAHEQIEFLQKLINEKLLVSKEAQQLTKEILFLEELDKGWKLYGKTGSGVLLTPDKKEKLENRKFGWFIGWIENSKRKIAFVYYRELLGEENITYPYGSLLAEKIARDKLLQFIKDLEN